ncbi:MAG: cytochrome c [Magnetococcales bacterium]|nr:cytochrome c [Magnetococcales bacterium]
MGRSLSIYGLPTACILGIVLVSGVLAGERAPRDSRELERLLKQDCGSCHGLTLRGGLGPPLTPDALADKSDEQLMETIASGRAVNAMPPWGILLERGEIRWLVNRLRRGEAP